MFTLKTVSAPAKSPMILERLEREADQAADSLMREGPRRSLSGAMRQGRRDTEHLALDGSGSALEPSLRDDMESRFHYDFSGVRIHSGTAANESARNAHANAYTIGHDVVFGSGKFAPDSQRGRRLLAHELAHVVQQDAGLGAGLVMRDTGPQTGTAGPAATVGRDTFWFQDPKIANDPKQPDRNRVFVEGTLTRVGNVNIRFAYPASEMTSGTPTSTVGKAKTQIAKLIAEVIADIGTFPGGSAADVLGVEKERARLGEAFRGVGTSNPLNIFIATMPSPAELTSDNYVPFTDSVYVNANDVGDRATLRAAIRVPLENLVGGTSAKTGKDLPAQSNDELKNTILHESLHAMLITKGFGGDGQWDKLKSSGKFKITGPSDAQSKGEELVRKFLIAQEEVFVYESVGLLYPPVAPVKADFDIFIDNAAKLLSRKGGKMNTSLVPIPVTERVDRKVVDWSIPFKIPGPLVLTSDDVKSIDLILMVYPNNF